MKLHEVVKVKIHQTQVSSAGDFTHTPNFGNEILAPVSGKAAKPLGFLGVFSDEIWRFPEMIPKVTKVFNTKNAMILGCFGLIQLIYGHLNQS